jgi:hypothetical protein
MRGGRDKTKSHLLDGDVRQMVQCGNLARGAVMFDELDYAGGHLVADGAQYDTQCRRCFAFAITRKKKDT